MENKFRNHPSLLLEQIGAIWGILFVVIIANFDLDEWKSLIKEIRNLWNWTKKLCK